MQREAMLAAIDALYEIRSAGLTEPMAALLAPGATFRLAGEGQMSAFGGDGPTDFMGAMITLNGAIALRNIRRTAAVVEGNRCALQFRAEVRFHDREPFETEIFNLWSFDEDGKVTSLTEFVDTAKLAGEVQALGGSLI